MDGHPTQHATNALSDRNGEAIRDFSSSLPMALLRARELVMDRFRPMLREYGVTEQQWRVLRILNEVGEIEATTLGQTCHILLPSLSRILRDLDGRGLLERRAADADQRVSLISISAEGKKLIAKVGPHSEKNYADIAEAMGTEKLDKLGRLLEELEQRLEASEATTPEKTR